MHGSKVNAAKTHCPDGHPYTKSNTYIHPVNNSRGCRLCKKLKQRKNPRKCIKYKRGPYRTYYDKMREEEIAKGEYKEIVVLSERDFRWPMNTVVIERGGKYKEVSNGNKSSVPKS